MWESIDAWANEVSKDSLASPNTTITPEIHVLLVDHEKESLAAIANMLQMCSYKVTVVELASTALAMLANGGEQFDIVIANIHSPDFQGFRLLETAVDRDIMTILMSIDEDMVLARRALECGAFMYIKKPVSIELVKYLWQHVMKERLRYATESTIENRIDCNEGSIEPEEESLAEENSDMENHDWKDKGKRKLKNQNAPEMDKMNNHQPGQVKKKVCTEWTQDLHAKFIEAVNELGEGRCYPKDILEKMNVPGLTRMQVASHLQKCRNDNWRAPEKRRSQRCFQPNFVLSAKRSEGARRFGIMPRSLRNHQPQQSKNQEKSTILELNSRLGSNTFAEGRGESSMPQVLNSCKSSMQFNLGTLSGIATEGIEIENEKSSGNGKGILDTVALEINSLQPHLQTLSALYNPICTERSCQSKRQITDDYFEFPDMDYIADNISDLQQGSDTNQAEDTQAYSYNRDYSEQVPMKMDMETRCLDCGSKGVNGANPKCIMH